MTVTATVNINTVDDTTLVHNTGNETIAGNKTFSGLVANGLGVAIVSASTIAPVSQIFHVSGATTIDTITVPDNFTNGLIHIIPDATFSTSTSGNIAIASTAVIGKVLTMVYDSVQTKWYPSY